MDDSMPQKVIEATKILLVWKLTKEIKSLEVELKDVEEWNLGFMMLAANTMKVPVTLIEASRRNRSEEITSDLASRKEFVRKIKTDNPSIDFGDMIPEAF
jgi:hypothetical protein